MRTGGGLILMLGAEKRRVKDKKNWRFNNRATAKDGRIQRLEMSLIRTAPKPADAPTIGESSTIDFQSIFPGLHDSAYVREAQLVKSSKPSNSNKPKPKPTPLFPFSSATLWRKVSNGTFPRPVKLSSRVTGWRVGAIRAFIEEISTQEFTK